MRKSILLPAHPVILSLLGGFPDLVCPVLEKLERAQASSFRDLQFAAMLRCHARRVNRNPSCGYSRSASVLILHFCSSQHVPLVKCMQQPSLSLSCATLHTMPV